VELFPNANRRSHAGLDPLEDKVVNPIAGKLLECTDVEQFFPYLALTQFRCKIPLPIIPLKYCKPSDRELFAAVKL